LFADDAQRLLRVDHYVRVKSIAPSMNGQISQVYVREVVKAGAALRGTSGIVLFIHGAGTPAEVAFDVPYADYSWMVLPGASGYDVFAMDMTGYGRSSRPGPMNDPCNLTKEQQAQFVTACGSANTERATTIESDWHDIDGVVEYVRKLRGGGQIESRWAGRWAGRARVGTRRSILKKCPKIVLLALAYLRAGSRPPPRRRRVRPFNTQNRAEFDANWGPAIGMPGPVRHARARIGLGRDAGCRSGGRDMGNRCAPGAERRSRRRRMERRSGRQDEDPALFVAALMTRQVPLEGVRSLHADYGAKEKVFVTWRALRITRCGRRIICCCFARRSSGSARVR
jgi:pimeloyl-ACP methyl ester carboxylesterase